MTWRAQLVLGIAVTVTALAAALAPPLGGAESALAQTTTSTTTSTTAATCADYVNGEGGSFFEPVVTKLIQDDTSDLTPVCASYTNVKLDDGIGDFVGTAPGQFQNQFAVSERPLTSAEAATAKADGRGFAYIPIAATPVSIVTLVPTLAWASSNALSITPSGFCNGIPLSVTDLGDLFGLDSSDPLNNWNDPRIQCTASGGQTETIPVSRWANGDPTMENEVVYDILDSTQGSKASFDAALQSPANGDYGPATSSDTPSETWPYSKNAIPGGDQPFIGKLLDVNADTNAPDPTAGFWQLGAIAPVSSVWIGSPLGVPWDLPTAAIQNAANAYVAPSEAAAAAAEKDATLASTSDPTTDNLVTFDASSTDTAAYNDLLMLQDYLVVPTNGLPADQAVALAQFIRFVLGTTGQKDIESFGAAPATAAMVTAGLKVAGEVDAEGLRGSTSSTTTTTTATSSSSSGTGSAGSSSSGAGSSSGSTGSSGSGPSTGATGSSGSGDGGSSSGSSLAFTGSNPSLLLILGVVLVTVSEPCRRFLRRRRVFR